MLDLRLVTGVLVALALSACGTTVPNAGQLAGGSSDGTLGLSPLGSDDPAVTGTAPGVNPLDASGTTTTGTARGPAGSGSGTPVVGPSSAATGTATTPGRATAASTAPVRVGLLYIDGADAVAGSLGISGLSTGDAQAQAKAVVAYLNAHGGLAGRRIDLREGRMSAAEMTSNAEGQHAQACSALVEDEKVSYVVSYVQLSSTQLACYTKHNVTVLDDQSSVLDTTGAQYASRFGGPGELALGRASSELVDALWRTGWLNAKSKVGTYVYDTPDGAAIEQKYLVPALARHGLTAAVKIRSSNGADGANQSASVVKLSSQHVDRVIPIGASPLFLMNAAESQGYRPAYAFTSTFGPGALMEDAAPPNQLKNAAGIGWSKYLDIGGGTKPGAVSANEALCFDIMRKAGQQSTSATVQAFQVALCNVLMFLKAGTDAYGVTPDLLTEIRSRGLAFPPADAFGIRMQPGRADGVSSYRDLVFDEGPCQCFQYRGGNVATS